jgi:hypothetical protein
VHDVLREELAIDRVGGVGRHRADHVGGVDVLDGGGLALLGEVARDLLLEPQPQLRELAVAARVEDG